MAVIGNSSTQQAFTPAVDYFSGNASTTAFTLSRPVASVAQVQVVIDNVAQNPSSAYTVSSNTITFTSAPLSGTNNIYVYYTSPITDVIAPGQGTVNTTSLGNITNIASGNSSLTLQTGSGNTTAVTVDTSQRVGFGTSSPSNNARLTVSGTTGSGTGGGILITGSGYQTSPTGMVLGQYDATTFYIQRPASSSFEIWDSASNGQVVVASSGNVFVGGNAQNTATKPVYSSTTAKVWAQLTYVNSTTTTIAGSFNVSSVSTSAGDYVQVNFSTSLANANYAVVTGVSDLSNYIYPPFTRIITTGYVRLSVRYPSGGSDWANMSIACFAQ